MSEEFQGSDAELISSAKALLDLDTSGALVPHGIGAHARTIIEAFIKRLPITDYTRDPTWEDD